MGRRLLLQFATRIGSFPKSSRIYAPPVLKDLKVMAHRRAMGDVGTVSKK